MIGGALQTQDGTWIVVDPHHGSASGSSLEEARREIERRKQANHQPAETGGYWSPWSVAKAVFG